MGRSGKTGNRVELRPEKVKVYDLLKIADAFHVPVSVLFDNTDTFDKKLNKFKDNMSDYSIKDLYINNLDDSYGELPKDYRQLGKAIASEIYKVVVGDSPDKFRSKIIGECFSTIFNKFKQINGTEEITLQEVRKILDECLSELQSINSDDI